MMINNIRNAATKLSFCKTLPQGNAISKSQNQKIAIVSLLRYIKQMFSFWVFEVFVSSLFLLVVLAFGEC